MNSETFEFAGPAVGDGLGGVGAIVGADVGAGGAGPAVGDGLGGAGAVVGVRVGAGGAGPAVGVRLGGASSQQPSIRPAAVGQQSPARWAHSG